jgi:hypothetical protein
MTHPPFPGSKPLGSVETPNFSVMENFSSTPPQFSRPSPGPAGYSKKAIIAFILSFLPLIVTSIAAIILGRKAIADTKQRNLKGHQLALASITIASIVLSGTVYFAPKIILAVGSTAPHGIGISGQKKYSLYPVDHPNAQKAISLNKDVRRTANVVYEVLRINPNADVTKVTPIQTGEAVVKIELIEGGWRAVGSNKTIEDGPTDYIEFDSVKATYVIHGYYNHFSAVIADNCECSEGFKQGRMVSLSANDIAEINTVRDDLLRTQAAIRQNLESDPNYNIASTVPYSSNGNIYRIEVVSQTRWAVIGYHPGLGLPDQDYAQYESWENTTRFFNLYEAIL